MTPTCAPRAARTRTTNESGFGAALGAVGTLPAGGRSHGSGTSRDAEGVPMSCLGVRAVGRRRPRATTAFRPGGRHRVARRLASATSSGHSQPRNLVHAIADGRRHGRRTDGVAPLPIRPLAKITRREVNARAGSVCECPAACSLYTYPRPLASLHILGIVDRVVSKPQGVTLPAPRTRATKSTKAPRQTGRLELP